MSSGSGQRQVHGPDHLQRLDLDGAVWVHVPVPSPEVLASIEVGTPIPAVVIETLGAPPARPQLTVAPGWTTWTLRPVGFQVGPAVVDAGRLVLAVGPDTVITAGQLPAATVGRLVERDAGAAPPPMSVEDGLAATILSDVLDEVGRVVDSLDDEVEDIETAVFAPDRSSHAERIYRLKREVQTVRRCIGPLPELLAAEPPPWAAATTDGESVWKQLSARARRLVEHLAHVDGLLDGVLTAHLARVAIQQNDDMRRISAWVAIVAAPTAIASIYGMNFRFMPELGWRLGYPLVLSAMLVVCTALYWLFRRSGWL